MLKTKFNNSPYTINSTGPENEYYKYEDYKYKDYKYEGNCQQFGQATSGFWDDNSKGPIGATACTEKTEVNEKERQDYDDLLFQHHKAMDKIRELEEIIRALLYSLRKTNVERLANEDESQHYQEMYAQENRRANQLFEIVEKSNINEYEKKQAD